MKRVLFTALLVSVCAGVLFTDARQAQAALGETVESLTSDAQSLKAVRGVAKVQQRYTVQEISSDAVTVREYVSPSGVVFAVAWNGMVHPELTSLLGTYFNEYEDALKHTPRKRGRRHAKIASNQVVVEKWGHMRNLQGRAYAPALIPAGVTIDEIK